MNSRAIQIFAVPGLPEIHPGDDLAAIIAGALRKNEDAISVASGDIFVVAQKVVSKSEERIVSIDSIDPSATAAAWAEAWGKDPRLVEIVLSESKRLVREGRGIMVCETRHGFVCANAGVDTSNAMENTVILLPEDPDGSAMRLRTALMREFKIPVGVIVSDTFGRPWREGLVNVALGVAGVPALTDYRGQRDGNGKLLHATLIATADEIASAAELVMGKADRIPVAIMRGFVAEAAAGTGQDLVRQAERDLFR